MKNRYCFLCSVLVGLLFLSFNVYAQPYQVPVYTVTSSMPAQPGAEPGKCIDGDDNTVFHSKWETVGVPDTLDFYLVNVSHINSIEYTPRLTGLNGSWGNIEIWYSTLSDSATFVKSTSLSWNEDNNKKTYSFPGTGLDDPYIIRFVVKSGYGDFSSCAEMKFFSDQVAETACEVNTNDVSFLGDTQLKVTGGSASSQQSGTVNQFKNSYDGNTSTLYHSNYNGGGFPITLTYNFSNVAEMDYIVYTPRLDGNINGRFGNVEVWYKTHSGGAYVKLMDFNCQQSASPSRILFPSPIHNIDNIQIKVLDGGNNFASCAEMQFFDKVDQANAAYMNIFADDMYSGLLPGITQSAIDTISSTFFKSLAQCMYNGTYNQQYRVQEYSVYPNVGTTAASLKIGTYNQFENPTGILFEANTKAVLFVDDYTGPGISLRVRNFSNDAAATDDVYFLSPGFNSLNIKDSGMGYISYYSDDAALQPVKINIVSGKVNGFFDVAKDNNADWLSLLSNNTYPMLDIKGKYINMMYYKSALKQECPFDGLGLVALYDSIVHNEFELMGLVKYNRVPKNHMFAYTEKSGGYYAGGMGAHFDLGWGYANIAGIQGVDLWGVAHELGHVNQVRPGMKWIGTTEVTNNLYSIWCQYTMRRDGLKTTRLEADEGQADSNSPSIKGGGFNSYLDASLIHNQHIQTQGVFNILTPLWQLELYYQVAGACRNAPALLDEMKGIAAIPAGTDYAHWLADVFEKVRNTNETGMSNGRLLLNFVKNACDAVQEDLTDFFVRSGFLRPINATIDDYGNGQLTVTQQDIDNTINEIKAAGYPQPVSPAIYYLSANSVDAYKNKLPASGRTGYGAVLNTINKTVTIDTTEWKNVAVYETYAGSELIHATIQGTGTANNSYTIVQYPDTATSIYAVGFDGNKILVYPQSIATPVKFVSVKATASAKAENLVTWNIAFEHEVDAYIVERSMDNKVFTKVGEVVASNNSAYSYTDKNSIPTGTGTIYYRIKAVNKNGSADYSDIAVLYLGFATDTKDIVFPNPFTDKLVIKFGNTSNIARIRLLDIQGHVILTKERNGQGELRLDVPGLPAGVYLLQLFRADGTAANYKLLKK